jgi:hypothetical protein
MSRQHYDHLVEIRQAIARERSRHDRSMRSLRTNLSTAGCDHRAPGGELLASLVNGIMICAICEGQCS